MENETAVFIKSSLLSQGVSIDQSILDAFWPPFLEKRRAYGNQDPKEFFTKTIPQELYILPDNLIVAINIKDRSPWKLFHEDAQYWISNGTISRKVTFPLRPKFYEFTLWGGKPLSQVVTLYGWKSLGLFVNGSCHLININKGCHYCSLGVNRAVTKEFEMIIQSKLAKEAILSALTDESIDVNQVMINGWNFPDLDFGFRFYVKIVKEVIAAVKLSKKDIEVHLIVAPPKDISLVHLLEGTNIKIAVNTEVYNSSLFAKYCPGKAIHYPLEHIFSTHRELVRVLGKNKVYSILVWGIEPIYSLKKGIDFLSTSGVTPVVNVFHSDPWTPLEYLKNPDENYIMVAGKHLQDSYDHYGFEPFYLNCWRNSLDTEAYLKLF